MRELKFRIWNGEKYLSGHELDNICIGVDGNVLIHESSELCVAGDSFVAQQFTGLKDKNGVEIYEGDIISCFVDDTDNSFSYKDKVVYKGTCFCLDGEGMSIDCFYPKDIEVLENTFENSGLLN